MPLQGQVQAALAVKAVISKGFRTAPPTLQRLRRAFHGQLATVGQSLETAVPLQGQVQAALAVKAVISKGSRTAPPTLQRLRKAFHGQLATVGQSLETAAPLQGQVQAALAVKGHFSGLPRQCFKGFAGLFMGSAIGQSLETAAPLQGQVQAALALETASRRKSALAVKAVISKGFRTAPPTLQRTFAGLFMGSVRP